MTLTTSQIIALRWSRLYLSSPHCAQPISSKWLKQFSLSDLLQHLFSCASWRISTRKRLRCKVWTAGTCLREHPILKIYCTTIVLRLNNTIVKTDLFGPYKRKTSCYFQINISGVYHLESHDSGYADYLLAMDIPKAAVPHILAA